MVDDARVERRLEGMIDAACDWGMLLQPAMLPAIWAVRLVVRLYHQGGLTSSLASTRAPASRST